MIKYWFLTGDLHGDVTRLEKFKTEYSVEEIGIIVLGDAGINFWQDKRDICAKERLQSIGYNFYLLRGNHDVNPIHLSGISMRFDFETKNCTYFEKKYPNIQYLIDGEVYTFGSYKTLVLGGAYSVDKFFRLSSAGLKEDSSYEALAQQAYWFKDEQLSSSCRESISICHKGLSYDFILSHTCPLDWLPYDICGKGVNQSLIDTSMEKWLNEIKNSVHWKVWCFGHFHRDRLERPHVELMYENINSMDRIYKKWINNSEEIIYSEKSPSYYFKDDTPFSV